MHRQLQKRCCLFLSLYTTKSTEALAVGVVLEQHPESSHKRFPKVAALKHERIQLCCYEVLGGWNRVNKGGISSRLG